MTILVEHSATRRHAKGGHTKLSAQVQGVNLDAGLEYAAAALTGAYAM
jgi:hypothetical protein